MKLFGWLAILPVTIAAVIEATDKDIDKIMSNGIPTILDIYATWCGHCKTFAPTFDEVAAMFEHAKDKIQFVKIDGDVNRKTAEKYKLKYFPTIKFVKGSESEDIDARTTEELEMLIKQKLGLKAKGKKPAPKEAKSNIVSLNDNTFEDAVDNKHALVAFTTTWCGYCKKLKPVWQELSVLYENDDDIMIVEVDCTEQDGVENLMETFDVRGFPTIVYFPKDGSTPRPYSLGRDVDAFVRFMHNEGISYRNSDGKLAELAGVMPSLSKTVQKVIGASKDEFDDVVKAIELSGSPYASKYNRIAKKVFEGGDAYIQKESNRLANLLKGKLARDKEDDVRIRLNILRTFVPSEDDEENDQSSEDEDDEAAEEEAEAKPAAKEPKKNQKEEVKGEL